MVVTAIFSKRVSISSNEQSITTALKEDEKSYECFLSKFSIKQLIDKKEFEIFCSLP